MRTLLHILVVLILPLAACGDGTGPSRIDGTYTLVSLNTEALPATVFASNAGRIDVIGSTLVLRADLSYTETIDYRVVPAEAAAYDDVTIVNGVYTVTGTTISFVVLRDDGTRSSSYTGTVVGNTLTYSFGGDSYAYRK
jgi:hypothetical protein